MLKKNILKVTLAIGDIFLMYGAILLALAIRYGDFSFWPGPQTKIFLLHFSFIHLIWLFLLFLLDFYEIPPFKRIFDFFSNLAIFLFLAGTVGVTYFYLKPEALITPKTILVLDVLIFGILLCGWRYLINQILKTRNFREKIGVLGFRPELKELLLKYLNQSGYEVVVVFSSVGYPQSKLESLLGLIKHGLISNLSKLKEIIKKEEINSIVFAIDFHKDRDLAQEVFRELPLKLNYISFWDFYESLTKKVPIDAVDEAWFLENLSRPERKISEVLKRIFDVFFSFLGLFITGFLFPLVALAIKLDSPGPIFYKQKRIGKDRKIFTLYKFRTMIADAEKKGPHWTLPNDPRITRVGKILRKLYIDELPQLWSILKGDLSFVGPRPEELKLAKLYEKEIPFYSQRYLIKPGFTGWAQINFPASASVKEAKEKFQYDLYYIKNRSFLLDLGIILKTIKIIFR